MLEAAPVEAGVELQEPRLGQGGQGRKFTHVVLVAQAEDRFSSALRTLPVGFSWV